MRQRQGPILADPALPDAPSLGAKQRPVMTPILALLLPRFRTEPAFPPPGDQSPVPSLCGLRATQGYSHQDQSPLTHETPKRPPYLKRLWEYFHVL